ncbi:IS66 family transposase [Paenibacillus sp. YYML68]|uniref:IS66 family transposase n=1 Tax=Paenibacillus sp. YYML68 TaxID=2909250 RepID=UPI0037C8140F
MTKRAESPQPQTLDEYKTYSEALEAEVNKLKKQVHMLLEQSKLAQHKRFGSSSEKTPLNQLFLFNEAEQAANPALPEPTVETVTHKRKKVKGDRLAKFDHLPVETVEYRLPEEEQVCSCCDGKLHEMSSEARDELVFMPAQYKIVRSVRFIYSCRHCERNEESTPVVTAKAPAPAHPGGLASASILAHVMHQKYVESLPLYRQEQQLLRHGLMLSRQTLANWMIYASERWLEPLFHYMKSHMLLQDILHADETTFPVLQEPGRKAEQKSYLWMYRTGHTSEPIVLYEYQPTRSGEHPRQFLEGFSGYLHADGFSGYHKLADVTLCGCWSHARRKFDEALKALPAAHRTAEVAAGKGLWFCNELFAVERRLKDVSPEARHQARQEQSAPLLEAYLKWLQNAEAEVLPKSLTGQAITYSLNQWDKLVAFMQDGRLEIDNNRAERAIKPVVIGRKNWIFANTPKGAKASATIYSIVESAKASGLNPYAYLKFLFEQLPQLPNLHDQDALRQLAPWSTSLPDSCRVAPPK